jgi:hypothetical protein
MFFRFPFYDGVEHDIYVHNASNPDIFQEAIQPRISQAFKKQKSSTPE